MSKLSELGPALRQLATDLTAVGDELDKATQEIVKALQDQELPADAQAALDSLGSISGRLKTSAQGLDALNPDAEPEPVPETIKAPMTKTVPEQLAESQAESASTATDAASPSGDVAGASGQ